MKIMALNLSKVKSYGCEPTLFFVDKLSNVVILLYRQKITLNF